MADEYKVSALYLEALTESVGSAELTTLALEVMTSIDVGTAAASAIYVEVLCSVAGVASRLPYIDEEIGTPDEVYPVFLILTYDVDYTDEGDNDAVFPIAHAAAKFIVKEIERNPFPAQLPTQADSQQEMLSEQQRVIREQHNKAQAGDTTFDFGLLLKSESTKQYTLGSLGRFFHPAYGLIIARYVQFKDMIESASQGQPVGRPKTAKTVDWVVTNQILKSSADLVMGICFVAETPADGRYGWVVTQGVNPTMIGTNQGLVGKQNDEYSWDDIGSLGTGIRGRVVARRWGTPVQSGIRAGELFINIEGMSQADFVAASRSAMAAEIAAVGDHATRLAHIEQILSSSGADAAAIQANFDALTLRIVNEERIRAREISIIRDMLGGSIDWSAAILTASNTLRSEFNHADDELRALIVTAQASADRALATLTSWDFPGLTIRVGRLETQLTLLTARVDAMHGGIWAPVTTGDLPGTLVFNERGECVMVEIVE